MKLPGLLLTVLLLGSPAGFAQKDAEPPNPVAIRVMVEFIEMPHAEMTKLLAAPRTKADDTDLRAAVGKLIEEEKARFVETQVALTSSGNTAVAETSYEKIYPTEYEPGDILPTDTGEEKEPAANPVTAIGPTPTAFETRNVGSSLEVQPAFGDRPGLIRLLVATGLVYDAGLDVFATWKTDLEDTKIVRPRFYSVNFNSIFVLPVGKPMFAAALSPRDEKGNADYTKKILLFVRAEALSDEQPEALNK